MSYLPDIVTAVSAALVTVGVLERAARDRWAPRWSQRGFTVTALMSTRTQNFRVLFAAASGTAAAWWYNTWTAAVGITALAWLAAVAVATDLVDRKIPREPCWVALGVASGAGALHATSYAAWSALVGLVLTVTIVGLLLLLSRGALGSGDARLLLALSSIAWWAGYTPILVGLLCAALAQVVLRFTAYRTHASAHGSKPPGYPFGPAIAAGYFIAVVLTGDPVNTCREWVGILVATC